MSFGSMRVLARYPHIKNQQAAPTLIALSATLNAANRHDPE